MKSSNDLLQMNDLFDQFSNLLDNREASDEDNSQYQGNLKRYCKEKLHVTFPPDVEQIFDSVEKNAVTIVKSANAVGKTYLAQVREIDPSEEYGRQFNWNSVSEMSFADILSAKGAMGAADVFDAALTEDERKENQSALYISYHWLLFRIRPANPK